MFDSTEHLLRLVESSFKSTPISLLPDKSRQHHWDATLLRTKSDVIRNSLQRTVASKPVRISESFLHEQI